MTIRNKFYDLLVNCVEGSLILKELILEMISLNKLKPENTANLINKAT